MELGNLSNGSIFIL